MSVSLLGVDASIGCGVVSWLLHLSVTSDGDRNSISGCSSYICSGGVSSIICVSEVLVEFLSVSHFLLVFCVIFVYKCWIFFVCNGRGGGDGFVYHLICLIVFCILWFIVCFFAYCYI